MLRKAILKPALTLFFLLGSIAQADAACNVASVQNLVGSTATFNAVNSAMQTSGASVLRVTDPGNYALTKDLNPNRLTIITDINNKITSLSCF